jgi:hypothetical protein
VVPFLVEDAADSNTIAAVISFACDNNDILILINREFPGINRRCSLGGVLHQYNGWNTDMIDGHIIQFPHPG